jgi:5-methylcytosine-specific restriction protein A
MTAHDETDLTASEVPGRNPTWVWDEIVLCCDLVAQNGWHALSADDQRIIELSKLLQELPIHASNTRLPDFRTQTV